MLTWPADAGAGRREDDDPLRPRRGRVRREKRKRERTEGDNEAHRSFARGGEQRCRWVLGEEEGDRSVFCHMALSYWALLNICLKF